MSNQAAEHSALRAVAIIVTFNSESTIIDCLASLVTQVDHCVVVDNCSQDNTVNIVRDKFPEVEVIAKKDNNGYGEAINVAAASTSSDIMVISNPDTIWSPGSVKLLISALQEEKAGIAGPTVENLDGSRYPTPRTFPSLTDALGHAFVGVFTKDNRWSRRYLQNNDYAQHGRVDWVSGAAMVVRRQTFSELHGFDERYFLYMEDVDLCRRAQDLGWPVVFQPLAIVRHVQGVSTSSRPFQSLVAHHRSLVIYAGSTNHGLRRLLLPIIWLGIGARFVLLLAKSLVNHKQIHKPSE